MKIFKLATVLLLLLLQSPIKSQDDQEEQVECDQEQNEENWAGDCMDGEGDEPDQPECIFNDKCATCNGDLNICDSDAALPCQFRYFYSHITKSCMPRLEENYVEYCTRYYFKDEDRPLCKSCMKGTNLYISEAQGEMKCFKAKENTIYECIDNCELCSTKRHANGNLTYGCYGCAPGYIGDNWVSDITVTKCTLAEDEKSCAENCVNCTRDENGPICNGCSQGFMIDGNDGLHCNSVNNGDFQQDEANYVIFS